MKTGGKDLGLIDILTERRRRATSRGLLGAAESKADRCKPRRHVVKTVLLAKFKQVQTLPAAEGRDHVVDSRHRSGHGRFVFSGKAQLARENREKKRVFDSKSIQNQFKIESV